MEFAQQNCRPEDRIITYQTVRPAPSCGEFGKTIYAEEFGVSVSNNGIHQGTLRNGTVLDPQYEQGTPLSNWTGGAYIVPDDCPVGSSSYTTFNGAVSKGIGSITTGAATN